MKKLFFISLGFTLILYSLFIIPGSSSAQTKLIVPIPVEGGIKEIANPGEYIRYIYLFGLSIGGLLGMAIIVYAAIERIVSAGNASKIADANDRITQAAIGLVLLFGAYIILRAINPNLTNLSLPTLEKVSIKSLPTLEKVSIKTDKTKTSLGELLEKYNKELEEAKLAAAKREAELKEASEKAKLANQQYEDNKSKANFIKLLESGVAASKAYYWEIAARGRELNRQLAVLGIKIDEAKQAGNKNETQRLNEEYGKLYDQYKQLEADRVHQQTLWQIEEEKLKKALAE